MKNMHQADTRSEEVIDLKELLAIVVNRKWLIVACMVIGCLLATFYGML